MKTFVNNAMIDKIWFTKGVTQGSVLRPLFYLLYINNMEKIGLSDNYTIYADDSYCIQRIYKIRNRINYYERYEQNR